MNNYNLDNITIVVPTYKRYPFLKRLLKFYDSFSIPIKILILDSTPNEPSDHEFNQLVSNNNIIWKKFSSDITYWSRVAKATEFIETDYVTLCADDDFILLEAVSDAVSFLKKNLDYSIVVGKYYFFLVDKNGVFQFIPSYIGAKSNKIESVFERFKYHILNTKTATFYAVHRTKDIKLIFNECRQYAKDLFFG